MNGLSIAPIANHIHRVHPFNLDTVMISPLFVQLLASFFPNTNYLWSDLPDHSVIHS